MAEPRFKADPPGHSIAADLDGLTALYHRPSGQTHLLAEPMPHILAALAGEVLSAGELLARLADRHAMETGGDALERLLERLAELESAGLVARA